SRRAATAGSSRTSARPTARRSTIAGSARRSRSPSAMRSRSDRRASGWPPERRSFEEVALIDRSSGAARATIGIIGGSGLDESEGLTDVEEVRLDTPFGSPSDAYVVGSLAGRRVAFLPRHGRGHRIAPGELNARANVFGFKLLGVERLISVSAVGSMREEIRPLDMVLPDQLFDRTRGRPGTFYGRGLVVHVGFADPVCADLADAIGQAADAV